MKEDVYPTGTCFEDMTILFAMMISENTLLMDDPKFLLVHAVCDNEKKGPYSHAWIEHGDKAFFSGIYKGEKVIIEADKKEYREKLEIKDWNAYNFHQAKAMDKKHNGAPPPWKKKYLKLCKDYKNNKEKK